MGGKGSVLSIPKMQANEEASAWRSWGGGCQRTEHKELPSPAQFSTPDPGQMKGPAFCWGKANCATSYPKLSLLVLLLCLKFLWPTVLAQSFENPDSDNNHIMTLLNHTSHIKQIIKFVCLSQSKWCKRAPKRDKSLFWGEAWEGEERGERNLFQGMREWEDRRFGWEPYIRGEGPLK